MDFKINRNYDNLYFLPLGGSDEIGMNVNLYGYSGQWLIVDLGITFGDDTMPGVNIILPDISFIEPHRNDICGLVLTHGHEDHIGAVPYLWERLGCPIYCTPFTASLVRRKLLDAGILNKVNLIQIDITSTTIIGPFEIEIISITHSIPESNMLILHCRAGTIVHSGDWKFDPTPCVGQPTNFNAISDLGKKGVLALVGDSTNVFVPGSAGSEIDVRKKMIELFAKYDGQGRIAVACFASNVARLESIALAAVANNRQCAMVGRSLWRMHDTAKDNGYLQNAPTFIKEEEVRYFPEDRIVLICTGSLGESKAALTRISDGSHPHISLDEGDICIFSSSQIPGNERAIARVQNRLSSRGVEVITTDDQPDIHVSGHPAREELAKMYQLLQPKIAIPVHGDARHLREHARLAKKCNVPKSLVPSNGSLVRLSSKGHAEIIEWIEANGVQVVDGSQIISLRSETLNDRRRMLHNGIVNVFLVLDVKGNLQTAPIISLIGVADRSNSQTVAIDAADAVDGVLRKLSNSHKRNNQKIRDAASQIVRSIVRNELNKRPLTNVNVVRI
ncbi:putative hydrolase of the metallo-beta-lactamase superfamily [Candidatus Endolissoclinum faulkneri L5]|uniref:Putative hydrolase of the metallo-beta-lactamase superfamily n=1 Tax=Candidatus Endolissoclinum faulkneri L5 TaxID=1401328 RepID=V9TTQ9_9PROT|nr:ribonuclease J [Candidatus Endolissoclinum faulkneri]AHC73552.1 putative hydrolase of the metallo-beta-lactamase superfamily [Candidatus Endolissoclinum faulkneri L5]